MEQLTTLDAGFLYAEDADRHTSLGMGGLVILDGPTPDQESLMATLGERIAACPRFAQRLRRRIFDLRAPEWIDDEDFNLTHHFRRVAVPGAGTDDALFRVVSELMSWRLERDHPLWEIWVIEGLSDDRWAMLLKVHPCVADGIATVHILTGLSDQEPTGDVVTRCPVRHDATEPVAGSAPDGLRLTSPAVGGADWYGLLRGPAQIAAGAVAGVFKLGRVLRGSAELASDLVRPESPLNGPTTSRRRYIAARVALADVKQICQTFEVTVNDVVLAALTESYRDMLLRHGEQPRPDSLRTLVPMSVEAPGRHHPTDVQRTVLAPYLPVDENNPVLRLRTVHARLTALKAAAGHRTAGAVAAAAQRLPFPVTALALDLLARLPQRSVAALAVNVPGPHRSLQIMGHKVVEVLPIPPIAMRLRTGAAILSYADSLFFGILADFDTVPDADKLARGVETAVARLVTRAKRRRAGRDRHGLSLVVNA